MSRQLDHRTHSPHKDWTITFVTLRYQQNVTVPTTT